MATEYELLKLVKDLIDENAVTDELGIPEFKEGRLDYEAMKDLIASQILELYFIIMNDTTTTADEKVAMVVSSMSYLAMENFVLHLKNKEK